MFAKQLLVALTLVSSIVAVQDCCYVELDNLASEGGMVSFPLTSHTLDHHKPTFFLLGRNTAPTLWTASFTTLGRTARAVSADYKSLGELLKLEPRLFPPKGPTDMANLFSPPPPATRMTKTTVRRRRWRHTTATATASTRRPRLARTSSGSRPTPVRTTTRQRPRLAAEPGMRAAWPNRLEPISTIYMCNNTRCLDIRH